MAMVIDRRTGKRRRVDPTKSRIAKRAAAKRRGKPIPKATRMRIAKSLKRVNKTGRTGTGRRAKI